MEAAGINDNGQIIAYAQPENYATNPVHAVVLTPQ
jgi:hypothetical protein